MNQPTELLMGFFEKGMLNPFLKNCISSTEKKTKKYIYIL